MGILLIMILKRAKRMMDVTEAHALPITDTDMQPLVTNVELALAV